MDSIRVYDERHLSFWSKVNGLETVVQPACYDSVSRTKQFTLLMRSSVSRLQMTSRTIFLLVLLTQYCWCKSACCMFLTVGMFSFLCIFYFRQFYFLLCVYTVCFVLYLHCLCGEYTSSYNVTLYLSYWLWPHSARSRLYVTFGRLSVCTIRYEMLF